MSVGCDGQHLRETDVAVDVHAHVGEHRIDQSVGDDADHSLDRFVGPHELRRCRALRARAAREGSR